MTFFLRAGFFCFFCIFGVGFLGVENYVVGFRYILPFFLRKHPMYNRKFCLCNETIYTQITTVTLTCPWHFIVHDCLYESQK